MCQGPPKGHCSSIWKVDTLNLFPPQNTPEEQLRQQLLSRGCCILQSTHTPCWCTYHFLDEIKLEFWNRNPFSSIPLIWTNSRMIQNLNQLNLNEEIHHKNTQNVAADIKIPGGSRYCTLQSQTTYNTNGFTTKMKVCACFQCVCESSVHLSAVPGDAVKGCWVTIWWVSSVL